MGHLQAIALRGDRLIAEPMGIATLNRTLQVPRLTKAAVRKQFQRKKRPLRVAARGLGHCQHSADFDVDVFFRFYRFWLLRHADGQHTLTEAGLDLVGIDALGQVEDAFE